VSSHEDKKPAQQPLKQQGQPPHKSEPHQADPKQHGQILNLQRFDARLKRASLRPFRVQPVDGPRLRAGAAAFPSRRWTVPFSRTDADIFLLRSSHCPRLF
jgi:hypothetical protein